MRISRRFFLNKQDWGGIAAIELSTHVPTEEVKRKAKKHIDDPSNTDDPSWKYDIPSSITITDCNNQVELNFGCSTQEHFNNSMYKLNTLLGVLTELKEIMQFHGPEIARNRQLWMDRQKDGEDECTP